jgi:hypothetical protein
MIVPTPVPIFLYKPILSFALSSAPPKLFSVPPLAFRSALMPASFPLASTYKPNAIMIGVIARLPK